jgi:thioredoxin-like negative regulator of GroEL
MKKIDTRHSEPLLPSEIASENVDSNIQTLAERSNKEDEIITEAMADVLVQQGRINKAVEVLKKLSLLNPSKSTYFAAKIEQLKD